MQEQIQSSRSGLQQFKKDIAANILRNNLLILKKRRIELIQEVLKEVVAKYGKEKKE
jgi:hypothetical protein